MQNEEQTETRGNSEGLKITDRCHWHVPGMHRGVKNRFKAEAVVRNTTVPALLEDVLREWLNFNAARSRGV